MILRGVLYAAGALFSLLMAGRLAGARTRLSWLFAAVMAVWSANCVLLFSLLVNLSITGDPRPIWSEPLFLANAFLLALAPLALWFLFPGGDDARRPDR